MADLLMKMPVPYEPKRVNRFIVRFPSSLGINEWYVTSAARPSAKINSVAIPFLNTSTYVAGRFEWNEIRMTFKDPIGPSASQALMEWLLDPTGVVVEKWIIQGAFITDLNFNELDYSRDDLASITCSLRMDRCIQVY